MYYLVEKYKKMSKTARMKNVAKMFRHKSFVFASFYGALSVLLLSLCIITIYNKCFYLFLPPNFYYTTYFN